MLTPRRVSSVLEGPIPHNVIEVRHSLGLTGYYHKLIRDYGKIAKPLTELTKKESFKWGVEVKQAFEALKKAITTPPVLSLTNFSKPFTINVMHQELG